MEINAENSYHLSSLTQACWQIKRTIEALHSQGTLCYYVGVNLWIIIAHVGGALTNTAHTVHDGVGAAIGWIKMVAIGQSIARI